MYKYLCFSGDRKLVRGSKNTVCKSDIIVELRKNNLYPLLVFNKKELKEITPFRAKLKSKELENFNNSFYMLLNTGISDTECVRILSQTIKGSKLKKKCKNLYRHLTEGSFIYQGSHYEGFPKLMVSSIRAGEENGTLSNILNNLAKRYDKEKILEEKLKQAMFYPVILTFVAIAAFIFASVYIIPSFAEIFYDFDVEPPMTVQLLLNIGEFLKEQWLNLTMGLAGFIISVCLVWKVRTLRLFAHTLGLKIPVIKDIMQKISISRFAGILSILLAGEVFLIDALKISADTIPNEAYKKSILKISAEIERGNSFESAIQADKLYPAYFVSLLEVSGESGDYKEMLEKGGEIYDREANSAIQSLVMILEPAVLIIMGLLVLLLAFSIIMPMYDIFDSIEL